MRSQQLQFPLLLAMPLLLALFVWRLEVQPLTDSLAPDSAAELPQAIVTQPRIQLFSHQGLLQQSFSGVSLISSGDGRLLDIRQPRFELADGRGDFWRLDAQQGFYDQNRDQLRLSDNVKMVRTTGDLPVQLFTDKLQLDISARRIHSDRLVRVESVGHALQGVGLFADLNQGTFEIHNRVEARHEVR